MKTQNTYNSFYFTQRQHEASSFVSSNLLAKARANDADALFRIGIKALKHKKLGFAEISFCFAARAGHKKAERAITLLKDYGRGAKWRDTVLHFFNHSIL